LALLRGGALSAAGRDDNVLVIQDERGQPRAARRPPRRVELGNGTPTVRRELYDPALDPHEHNVLFGQPGGLTGPQRAAYARLRQALTELLASR
jgi:hypothetical protein